jgi:hypothetical protein
MTDWFAFPDQESSPTLGEDKLRRYQMPGFSRPIGEQRSIG